MSEENKDVTPPAPPAATTLQPPPASASPAKPAGKTAAPKVQNPPAPPAPPAAATVVFPPAKNDDAGNSKFVMLTNCNGLLIGDTVTAEQVGGYQVDWLQRGIIKLA